MTYEESVFEKAFAALADPSRRHVFERLRAGPLPVGAIAQGMPVSRPAVSQHLKVLKEAGLVTDRAMGTRRIYAIDPHGLVALRSWLDQFWDDVLVAFAAQIERNEVERNPKPKPDPKLKKGKAP
jgi:DNA-binding transcriptional ArsR family regulator